MTPNGELDVVAEKALMLEKLADLVDREMSSVTPEEMGRPVYGADEALKDPRYTPIIKWLGKNYDNFVSSLAYDKLKAHPARRTFLKASGACAMFMLKLAATN